MILTLSPIANPSLVPAPVRTVVEKDISVPDTLALVSSNASDTNVSEKAVYSTLSPLVMSSLGYISCLP